VTTEVFFGKLCRSRRIRYGAIKTLDPEWLRTGNRNLLGVREDSAQEIALVTIQVFKDRHLREYAFISNAVRLSQALRAWKSTVYEYGAGRRKRKHDFWERKYANPRQWLSLDLRDHLIEAGPCGRMPGALQTGGVARS
jgi:hypothetical protein